MATTWTQLAEEIKTHIQQTTETGQLNVQSVTDLDGISHTFYSLQELIDFYNSVNSIAQAEDADTVKPKWRPIAMRRSGFRR